MPARQLLPPSLLALFAMAPAFAECEWSEELPIPNEYKLSFQECVEERKIRIGDIEVQATIDFEIVHEHYPEGNSIWSRHSPNGEIVVVWVENSQFLKNAWVIDLVAEQVLFHIQHTGKHFWPEFGGDDRFRLVHAGMGYRTEDSYERIDGEWAMTGTEKIDVEW